MADALATPAYGGGLLMQTPSGMFCTPIAIATGRPSLDPPAAKATPSRKALRHIVDRQRSRSGSERSPCERSGTLHEARVWCGSTVSKACDHAGAYLAVLGPLDEGRWRQPRTRSSSRLDFGQRSKNDRNYYRASFNTSKTTVSSCLQLNHSGSSIKTGWDLDRRTSRRPRRNQLA